MASNRKAVSSTWSYRLKSLLGGTSTPASRCSFQWRARSAAAVACRVAISSSPAQCRSSARFSSRLAPMRGKPRLVTVVIAACPHCMSALRNEGTAGRRVLLPAHIRLASDLRPRGRTGCREKDTRGHAACRSRPAWTPATSPRRFQVETRDGRVPRPGPVFGLMDTGRKAHLVPVASQAEPSAVGRIRFHSPLRGSSGMSAPGAFTGFPFNSIPSFA